MIEKLKDKLRMAEFGVASLILLCLIWFAAPQQMPVVMYKLLLVTLFAHLGYWIDRRLFPSARPSDFPSAHDWHLANMRRAGIVAAVVLSGAMAL